MMKNGEKAAAGKKKGPEDLSEPLDNCFLPYFK